MNTLEIIGTAVLLSGCLSVIIIALVLWSQRR